MGADIRPTSTVRMGETTWTLEVFFRFVLFFIFVLPSSFVFGSLAQMCLRARNKVAYIFYT